MDAKRYTAFVSAVETKSLSGAGKELGYTPSGIIRLINALEDELGFPLLIRSSTGVEPTAEGRRMLPIFQQMVKLNEKAQQTSARIRGLAEGTLTIGALDSAACERVERRRRHHGDADGVACRVVGRQSLRRPALTLADACRLPRRLDG